jgi:H+-transporting ATPase
MALHKGEIVSKFIEGEPDDVELRGSEDGHEREQQSESHGSKRSASATDIGFPGYEEWDSSDEEIESSDGEKKEDATRRPVPEELLTTDPAIGLSDQEVKALQKKYGKNMLEEEKESFWKKLLGYFWGPIQVMIEAAAILSLALRQWIDLGMIVGLLVLNAVVGFLQEGQAGNAISELKKGLALKAHVTRNGKQIEIDASDLTIGDIIYLSEGDVVPADARLVGKGAFLLVDQSALTGR